MRYRACAALTMTLFAMTRPALAQAPGQQPTPLAPMRADVATVVVGENAPVFLLPDATLLPLRVAKEGSTLRLIEQSAEWCHVEFQDPQYGRRVGYIQTKFVRVNTTNGSLEPLDLSVPGTLQPPPPSRAGQPPAPIGRQAPAAMTAMAAPASASSEESHSSGFFIGVGAEGDGIVTGSSGNSITESGGGGGVILGYGFSPRWSLYGNLSVAAINAKGGGTYDLAHLDIGTRVHFLSGAHRVVPFLQFGVSGRGEGQTVNGHTVTASGGGGEFGVGMNAHFTPRFAFSTAVTWSVGEFTNYQIDHQNVGGDSVTATSARVHLGLIWFP